MKTNVTKKTGVAFVSFSSSQQDLDESQPQIKP